MKRLSIFLIAALLLIVAIKSAKANAEVNFSCGCQTMTPTPTSSPIPTQTPLPTLTESPTPAETQTPSSSSGSVNGQVGAPICTASVPSAPVITSVTRKGTSAILTWTSVQNASYYLIFYGTTPGSEQFGVPNTGNVTTFTINALNPNLRYFFEVRAVNNCMPSAQGQVLGASTSVLAATSSENWLFPNLPLFNISNYFSSERGPTDIKIPKIKLDVAISGASVSGNNWQLFSDRVAWLSASKVPGRGNTILYAHERAGLFGDLYKLKTGDEIKIFSNEWNTYKVTKMQFVKPNDVNSILSNKNRLTLFTCSGAFDQKRLVVYAE